MKAVLKEIEYFKWFIFSTLKKYIRQMPHVTIVLEDLIITGISG